MILFILALVSSALYRTGGAGTDEIPFANSQYRDIGCPVIVLIALLMMGHVWYLALLSSLLVLGFIRTYHDYLTGDDNLYLHSLFIGLSMIPLAWSGVDWWRIVAYTSILTVSIGGLNTYCTRNAVKYSVWVEELSRGFIIVIALAILSK